MISIINFAKPTKEGINVNDLDRFSRNPIYIVVIIFQISSHWMILAEERWCIEKFSLDYTQYLKKVRRYI